MSGLASVADVRRALEIVFFDTLGLENSPSRNRLLIAAAEGATRLLEVEREEALAGSLLDDGEDE